MGVGGRRILELTGAACLVVSLATTPAEATFPGTNGRIALTRNGIVTVLPDGSAPARLTRGEDLYPTYSPDGSKIAFVRVSSPEPEVYVQHLYVMDADGTKVHRASGQARGWVQPPRWSPNGRWIAFEDFVLGVDDSGDETYKGAIKIVRPNGSDQQRVTGFTARNGHPSWAPDSRRIFFDRTLDKASEIFVMDRDGSDKTQLTNAADRAFLAEVSPDGSKILFLRPIPAPGGLGDQGTAIWIMDSDGSDPVQLTDGSRFDSNPRWSPNGASIAFVSTVCTATDCAVDLWTMDAAGGNLTNLTETDDRMVDYTYTWSPDSAMIAATLDDDVYAVEVTSGAQTPIATRPAREVAWDWQAVP